MTCIISVLATWTYITSLFFKFYTPNYNEDSMPSTAIDQPPVH